MSRRVFPISGGEANGGDQMLPRVTPKSLLLSRDCLPPDVRIYSDASLTGFGVVICIGTDRFWSAAPVTAEHRLRFGATNIAVFEGIAAICALLMLEDLLKRSPGPSTAIHFVDNMGVTSNLISGYSRNADLVTLMLEYYLVVTRMQMRIWHETRMGAICCEHFRCPIPRCFGAGTCACWAASG